MHIHGRDKKLRKGNFFQKVYLWSHEKQRGRRKGGRTQRRVNGTPNPMLSGRTPRINDQYLIVYSENYSYSSFRVASMDENKTELSKDYHDTY